MVVGRKGDTAAARRFEAASARMHASVSAHVKLQKLSDSESEEDQPEQEAVLERVTRCWVDAGAEPSQGPGERTRRALEDALQAGATHCLICIERVKRTDEVWNCASCYTLFHLSCVSAWARDQLSALSSGGGDSNVHVVRTQATFGAEWSCPKCRRAYTDREQPSRYFCYCGKCSDPPYVPLLVPHSCGELCGRPQPSCSHTCLLLCHPGPCPSCPVTVQTRCMCGAAEKRSVRCHEALWSCGRQCKRLLQCGVHPCKSKCHEPPCAPCDGLSKRSCRCGAVTELRPCQEPPFICEKVCGRSLSCGVHKCKELCHGDGACGDCPQGGLRTCPCGRSERLVQCPEEPTPCEDTCSRELACGQHTCPARCHIGKCPPCPLQVMKACICGAHSKTMACAKEYRCDVKCGRIRACGRHKCSKRCCDGACPPCDQSCNNLLSCRNHKCERNCHRGRCEPCGREARVTCRCGQEWRTVPCGREKRAKPVVARHPCRLRLTPCRHEGHPSNAHVCHFGECPACKAPCEKPLPCGHNCGAVCHESVSLTVRPALPTPSTPCDLPAAAPSKRLARLECPPCPVPVVVECVGRHERVEKPCSQARREPCGRKCGRPLQCGNHRCEFLCHSPQKECSACERDCELERSCEHECERECHPAPCKPCVAWVRVACYCGVSERREACHKMPEEQRKPYSCGKPCPGAMECGHKCKRSCHPSSEACRAGPEMGAVCTRRVRASCVCGTLRAERPCHEVRGSSGEPVPCGDECQAKKAAEMTAREEQERREQSEREARERRELEQYNAKFNKPKRTKRARTPPPQQTQRPTLAVIAAASLALIVAVFAMYYNDLF